MELTLELLGADKLIQESQSFRKRFPGTVLNAMRRQLRRTITVAKKGVRTESGIGRTIFGKKASGLNPLVSLIRARLGAGGDIETGIKVKGLPKLIEEGGQIKRHNMTGRPFMVFQVDGKTVFAKKVNHPGAPVRRHSIVERVLNRDAALINREVADAIGKLKGEVFGEHA